MERLTFTFGKNWTEFTQKYLSKSRLKIAEKSLIDFFEVKNFKGKSFLDIGCGSGIFSLAALKLQASYITSFDLDQDSVNCCTTLWKQSGKPKHWKILKGSVLDLKFMKSLGKFDYIYAWGVLHHTGNMRKAIDNTCISLKQNGKLYLAIYNKEENFCIYNDGRFGSSQMWMKIKKSYFFAHPIIRNIIDELLTLLLVFIYLLRLKNPFKQIQKHNNLRGMSLKIDLKDWMGGYPYEYAKVDEIFNYIYNKKFQLIKLICGNGLRNNEYLFIKK